MEYITPINRRSSVDAIEDIELFHKEIESRAKQRFGEWKYRAEVESMGVCNQHLNIIAGLHK